MRFRDLLEFLRANPQAAILLAICVVLGLGTLIAELFAFGGGTRSGAGTISLASGLVGR